MEGLQYNFELPPRDEFVRQLTEDFAEIVKIELNSKGIRADVISDNHQLLAAYSSLLARRVVTKRRSVHVNPDLVVPVHLQSDFECLIQKFRDGASVNPHLSKSVAALDRNDLLFYDWGINHFHLGSNITNGFVNRSGPLVFAVVKSEDVFVVSIANHGEWSDISMIEIIDKHWPQLIASNKIEGKWETEFNSEEIKQLRKGHVNVGITLSNGSSYISLGGGYTSAGTSMLAELAAAEIIRDFVKFYPLLSNKCTNRREEITCLKDGIKVSVRLKKKEDNSLWFYIPEFQCEYRYKNFISLPI